MSSNRRIIDPDVLFTAIDMWAVDFRVALMDKKTYHTRHNQYYLDARILKQQLGNMEFEGTTVFNFTTRFSRMPPSAATSTPFIMMDFAPAIKIG